MKPLLLFSVVVALVGCNQTQINTPVRVFDRPSDVALACNQVNENGFVFDARPIGDCTPERISDLSLDAAGNQRLLPSGAVNSPGLSAFVVQSSRGELAHVDVVNRRVVDLQRPVPGYGFLPVGDLPEHVRVSTDGCVAVTANTGSCDLASVDLPVLYNMPFLPYRDGGVPEDFGREVVRRLTPTVGGKPLGARPAWIEFASYTEPALRGWEPGGVPGQCVPRSTVAPSPNPTPGPTPYHAWVALPNCELVVELDLSAQTDPAAAFTPGEVLRAIRVTRTGAEVVSDLTSLSCPSECSGAPMDTPPGGIDPVDGGTRLPTTQAQPSTIAVDADTRIGLGRLFIGDRTSDRITIVPFDVNTGAVGTPHQLTLDASALGVEVVRISPRTEAGKFLYAVARDATVRVVDLDREVECETNPDPRALQDIPPADPLNNVRRLGCLPVGDPATPRRAPLSTSPGITLPGSALPKDVAFVHTDVPLATATNIAPPAAGPTTLVGDFAWIIGSDGRATVVNIFDACPSPNQPQPANGSFNPACSPASVNQSRQDAFLNLGHPLPMELDRVSHRLRGGVSRFFLPTNPSDNVGQPRLTDEINPFQVSIGGLARGGEILAELPTLQKVPVPVPAGFPMLPAASNQRFISFYDPEKVRNETWTLTWEGTIPGTQRTLGAIVFNDAVGPLKNPKLLDAGAAYCSRGVAAGDKVALTGCDSDSDCSYLDLCIRDPSAPIGVTDGICLRRSDQARLQELCAPFLRGVRRFRVLSAKQGAPINTGADPNAPSGVTGGVSDILELGEIYQPEHPVETHVCVANADCQDVKVANASGTAALDTSCLQDSDGVHRCLRSCGADASCGLNYQCLPSRFGDQRCMRVPLDPVLLEECMPELQTYEIQTGEAFLLAGSLTGVFVDSQANPTTFECEIPPMSSEFVRLHQSRIPLQPAALCPAAIRSGDPLSPLPADFIDPVSGVATNVCQVSPDPPSLAPKADRIIHFENPMFGILVKIPGTDSRASAGGMDMGGPAVDMAEPADMGEPGDLGGMGAPGTAPADVVPPTQFALNFSLVGSGFPLGVSLAVDVQAQQPRYATTSPDGQTVFIVDEGKQNTGVGLRGQLLKLSSSAVAIDRNFQVR